ncbi:phytoene/squalene synthase family protein [Psychrobacillus sp. FSL W7-1457]|uniref:phytoene/squalene synthase family protein n=1 Tax=Psychrobacillus sp. FSL W7-1457 TaxID=2954547 RepID=UPI003159BE3A
MRKQDTTVKDYYRYCEEIIKKNSKSFYFAFSQLPEDKANAVFAIYTFCRRADDSVDENGSKVRQKEELERLIMELQLFEKGEEIQHPMWLALRDVFNRYNMSIEPFYEQLEGQRMDINFTEPMTLKELEKYSYYVAGTVGLMLLPVLAQGSSIDLTEQAISLGIAMQITNILRDIGEDYQIKNRIYIPQSLLASELYSADHLKNATINSSFIRIWESLAQHAEELYDNFFHSIFYFDEDSRFQVLLAAKVYRGILNAVRKNNYDCFHVKNYVSPIEMQKIHQAARFVVNRKVLS